MEKIQLSLLSFFLLFTSSSYAKTKIPEKIVSTSLASDEILLYLFQKRADKKRIHALSTLADNSEYSFLKEEAKAIPQRTAANIEQILKMKADLVISASYNQAEFLQMMEKLKVPHHIMEGFESLRDLRRHILTLADLTDTKKEGDEILKNIEIKIESFKKENPRKLKVLPILPDRTLIGSKSLLDDLIKEIRFVNLVSHNNIQGWQKISEEKLLDFDPDFILTPGAPKEFKSIYANLGQSPALRKMKAFRNKKIVIVPSSIMSSFSPSFLEILNFLKVSYPSKSSPQAST